MGENPSLTIAYINAGGMIMAIKKEHNKKVAGLKDIDSSEKLLALPLKELTEIARSYGITGISRLPKSDLVEKLVSELNITIKTSSTTSRKASPLKKEKKTSDLSSSSAKKTTEKKETALPKPLISEQEEVETAKYTISHETPLTPQPAGEPVYTLPSHYGTTKIVLMPRDPYWLYTYWEITLSKMDEIKKQYGEQLINESKSILRVHDITGTSPETPCSSFDIELSPGSNNWYINVPYDSRVYCVDIGYRTKTGAFILIARSNSVITPPKDVSSVIDEKWMCPDEFFNKVYALSGGFFHGMNALSSIDFKQRKEEMFQETLTSGALFSGTVSSAALMTSLKEENKQRDFFLEVDTELIVYGRTMPDARVTIQGIPKKINSDGTFSIRFALSDGKKVIPVTAQSSDGIDTITITPVVERETR